MNRRQADRTVIAARAAHRPGARASTTGTNLAARTLTVVNGSGPGIRRPKARMTGAQRNSEGRRSEWNESPYLRDAVANDSKWSQTIGSQRV